MFLLKQVNMIFALTDHLNSIDTTGSIKFTYEEESGKSVFPGHTDSMKGGWNSETPTISEEDPHRPVSELYLSPSITSETGGHQNING